MTSPISTDDMKSRLGGMHWTPGRSPLAVPHLGSAFRCAMVFKKHLAEITWHFLRTLEKSPATLPQIQTILAGQSVAGLSIAELLQVRNYGDAAKRLVDKVRFSAFALDPATLGELHHLTERADAPSCDAVRTESASTGGAGSSPSEASAQNAHAQTGLHWLNDAVANPKERAVATFLFLSRSRFFHAANERTASLMMNGVLMSCGYLPIVVLPLQAEAFRDELKLFCETGDADGLFAFFADLVPRLYHDLPKDLLQPDPFAA